MTVSIKTPEEIKKMHASGQAAANVLKMIATHVKPGTSTEQLDRLCHDFITQELRCIPAPLNYKGFPKSICTSVNHVVCHGIPTDKKILKNGDIINIDVTVIKDGYHGDTSKMFFVGNPSILAKRVCEIAHQAMQIGIHMVKPGIQLGDIGFAIQQFAESHRFSVVREYCGHGIGINFHEEPQVLHYGSPNTGEVLKEGMCFTIEPMINTGKRHTRLLPDGWTVITKDRSLSAQWEHTIAVTKGGYKVLTQLPNEAI